MFKAKVVSPFGGSPIFKLIVTVLVSVVVVFVAAVVVVFLLDKSSRISPVKLLTPSNLSVSQFAT